MALSSRILGDKNRNGAPTEWADILSADLPRWEESSADAEYWYFATLAISHYDPLGPVQSKWNTALKEIIVRNQSGGNEGSWKAIGRLAGKGAAHTTALNTLTLTIIGR
ncbi:MAG: hypothetical protein A2Z34_03565 [Planctomycetes bacterium RBG_16_59_8]|nr:MAG: hypothetical protein A2Z34_03565 [Planctomycetes bacterium RBG_16_59_8]